MRLDQYSNPVFNEQDIFEALYKGQTLSPAMFVDPTTDTESLANTAGIKFTEPYPEDLEVAVAEYDAICQANWNMPEKYKQMDIEEYLVLACPEENYPRLIAELNAFKERNMLDLLRWLKYFVDTCEEESVVWGIGRGSSVASYVLFLIGVHSVDSVKYNLDWQEFLR